MLSLRILHRRTQSCGHRRPRVSCSRLDGDPMQKFSQQGQRRGPAAITPAHVEHFIRRMRLVSQANSKLLLWVEEACSETVYVNVVGCAQHVVAYRQAFQHPEESRQGPVKFPRYFHQPHHPTTTSSCGVAG